MAVNPSPLLGIRESQDISPAIQNLQLAFKRGVLDASEIADALTVGQPRRELARESTLANLELLPKQTELANLTLDQQIAQAPARATLEDLQLQSATQQAQAGLDIGDAVAQANRLQVEQQVGELESLLGAQPFASTENALNFFQRTRPGEKVPKDPKKLSQANREAFNAIQSFKLESQRFLGRPTTESFVRVNPQTFDKERVRVTFDGSGKAIDTEVMGTVEVGAKSLTEQQANAVQFSARMRQAQANLDAIEGTGFDPAGIKNFMAQFFSRNKLGALASGEAQQYEAAKRNWIAAVLRKESGAAISQSEYRGADHQYFPQPGDTPGTIAQKRQLRNTALNTMQAAGLFGLPPAQQDIIKERFETPVGPSLGEIKSRNEVVSDSEFEEMMADKEKPGLAPLEPERVTDTVDATVTPAANIPVVGTPAEVTKLPPDVKFFSDPSGKLRRNPNYRGGSSAR